MKTEYKLMGLIQGSSKNGYIGIFFYVYSRKVSSTLVAMTRKWDSETCIAMFVQKCFFAHLELDKRQVCLNYSCQNLKIRDKLLTCNISRTACPI